MRICIPAENNNGLSSTVCGHFGSAPYFIIYDTNSKSIDFINNADGKHEHGQCNPLASFANKPIDIMITGGIGARALQKLNAGGVKAYKTTIEQTAADVVKSFECNLLEEITLDNACSHQHHHHGSH
jgi:predicted Fe-Mo cluster-binding NifX family protein